MRMGVDYYPEHWTEERWPIDARLMREARISIVRVAEFAWCRLEPREAEYDFDWLDRALAVLHAEGIEAVVGIPTAAPPAWLHERYPDIYPADFRRYRLGFGTRLQRCLNNPAMRHYAGKITEAMARHFASHPAVIGWQIDNEFEANLCYCDICAAGFRRWLQERYGTLEQLNKAWGTIFWSQEYGNWSQIPLPWQARCGQSHNPSLLLEYRRFASDSTISYQRELAGIIRRETPHQFITHNFMGLSDSLDYTRLVEDLDLVSWDNYPLGSWESEAARVPLAHDVMRGVKQRNFWVMEEQSGVTGWETMSRRPAPGQVRAWAWQAVGRGADAVVFFRWRSCLYGTEQFWQGILDHDGEPRRRYEEVARLGRELSELSAHLDGSTVRNEVAILNSYEQNWALQIQPQVEGLAFWEQVRRFHDAFGRLGANVDVVPLSADLARYRMVVAPSWYVLTAADAERLAEYARGGGILVLNPRTGVKTEFNTCHPLPGPSLLREAAGLQVIDNDPMGRATVGVEFPDNRRFSACIWADDLALAQAKPIAFYRDGVFAGRPAAARHEYGRGAVYYLGFYGEPCFYDALFGALLAGTGIGLAGLPPAVDACWREKDGARFLFLINLSAEELSVRVPTGGVKLLGGEPVSDRVSLPAFGVGVYQYHDPHP